MKQRGTASYCSDKSLQQSIGFTADVPNSQEPPLFFTPNGKESNNILDLVETSGKLSSSVVLLG